MAATYTDIDSLINDAPPITSANFTDGLEWLNSVIAFCKNDKTTTKNKTFPAIVDDATNYAFSVDINKTQTADVSAFNNYIAHIKAELTGIKNITE
jgi:hypothetical protein